MYTYFNNNSTTTTATTTEEDHAPLLSSNQSINYSSIHRHSIDYANSLSAVIDDSFLYEQDNESIRRRQRRRSSSITSSLLQHKIAMANNQSINNSQGNNTIFSRSFWQSAFDRYSTSVYLENKGSVARDHLANERTYLAWLRTSLSTISVGIGITQLFRLERTMTHNPPTKQHMFLLDGQMIGLLFIFLSILLLLFAFIRYFHAQAAMIKGFFPASRSTVIISSCLLLFTMTLMLISVLYR